MTVKSTSLEQYLVDFQRMFITLRKYGMKLNPEKCTFAVQEGRFLGFMISNKRIEVNLDKVKAVLDMQPPKTIRDIQRLNERIAALNQFVARSAERCLIFFKILRKNEKFE